VSKYRDIADLVRRRLQRGDYALKPFPGEVELAGEVGASRITVRRALRLLIDEELLYRAPNRRLMPVRGSVGNRVPSVVGFLAPSHVSLWVDRWRLNVEHVADRAGVRVRPLDYIHPDDPVIADALGSLDGVFFVPSPARGLEEWATVLREAAAKVAVVNADMSELGLVSILSNPPRFITTLLDYLREKGHRRIDCFNVQPMDRVIEQRIDVWRQWCAASGTEGRLLNDPVREYGCPRAQGKAAIDRLISAGELDTAAIMCTTEDGALGAIRSLVDHGVRVGRDVSVCATKEAALARYMVPSLTTIAAVDPQPYLSRCIDWFRGKARWAGSLIMAPRTASLLVGESTGPPPPSRQ
jgi:DNA-binding LacI/PurR family transcriptional regulator